MAMPHDEEREERPEERRKQRKQQHDRCDHNEVGEIVGLPWELELWPPLGARGSTAAVSVKIGTARRAGGGDRVDRRPALWASVGARHWIGR
jgi:hypothetical protein